MDEPRQRVADLAALLRAEFGTSLLGLYLFGSLPAGHFVEGRSDLDLLAVLESDVDQSRLSALEALHSDFAASHPDWLERVEVGYVSRDVLQTLGGRPAGTIAVISPGEALNIKEVDWSWVLNWYSVCTSGEVLCGPPPSELGPAVSVAAYKAGVAAQLAAWREAVRAPWIGYVPAQQGYIVVTICRALYGLETGELTSKEAAAAWAANEFPEWSSFIHHALAAHRADPREPHAATVRFVDFAVEAARQASEK